MEKKRRKKVVILGDSLAMPRDEDKVTYENTYAYQLALHEELDVICRAVRANDTSKQSKEQALYDDIICFRPDIIIIHLGIVDCAPRLFSKKHIFFLSFFPSWFKKKYMDFFSKYRPFFTRRLPKVYVKKEQFEKNIVKIMSVCRDFTDEIYCISISDTNKNNKIRSYGFSNNIETYNDILKAVSLKNNVIFFDLFNEMQASYLLDDGIHLTPIGHKKIYEELSILINRNESSS